MNKVAPFALRITLRARQRQRGLDVADMHADTLLCSRDLLTRSTRGQADRGFSKADMAKVMGGNAPRAGIAPGP